MRYVLFIINLLLYLASMGGLALITFLIALGAGPNSPMLAIGLLGFFFMVLPFGLTSGYLLDCKEYNIKNILIIICIFASSPIFAGTILIISYLFR